jgi:hypothetical protein
MNMSQNKGVLAPQFLTSRLAKHRDVYLGVMELLRIERRLVSAAAVAPV